MDFLISAFSKLFSTVSVLTFTLVAILGAGPAGAETKTPTATPAGATAKLETATFAAGCFWGTEEFFRKMPGVVSTRVGYTGGHLANPHYEDTHESKSGHAESVEVQYNPKAVSYEHLLDQFFKMHDPTTLNSQGNDKGSEYRSAIFTHSDEQMKEAVAFKAKVAASGAWKKPITTEITPAPKFWVAEDYHQKYISSGRGTYDNHYLRDLNFDTSKQKSVTVDKKAEHN